MHQLLSSGLVVIMALGWSSAVPAAEAPDSDARILKTCARILTRSFPKVRPGTISIRQHEALEPDFRDVFAFGPRDDRVDQELITISQRLMRPDRSWLHFSRHLEGSLCLESMRDGSMRASEGSGELQRWESNELEIGWSALIGLDPALWLELMKPTQHWEIAEHSAENLVQLVQFGRRANYWFTFDLKKEQLLEIRKTHGAFHSVLCTLTPTEPRFDDAWVYSTTLGRIRRILSYRVD